MRKIILAAALSLIVFAAFAQQADRATKHERLEAQRISFLTERLELTPDEAETFWPIYKQYKTEQRELKKNRRPKRKVEEMSDQEIEAFILQSFEREEKEIALKRKYFQEFKKVLPIKKIGKLQMAEKEFRRKVIDRLKGNGERRRREN